MDKTTLTIILALLVMISGCALLPAKPGEVIGEGGTTETVQPATATQPAPAPEPQVTVPAAETPAQVPATESKYTPAVSEVKNETSPETEKLMISGSLKLQSNTQLCPHLIRYFECNKYDIRSCPYKTLVGQKDFYPEQMICRSGYSYKKEDPNHKYCFVQECRTLEKNNVVYAYGGPVIYAEYAYAVQQTGEGILTKYNLVSCGEEYQEFKTSNECKTYQYKMKST